MQNRSRVKRVGGIALSCTHTHKELYIKLFWNAICFQILYAFYCVASNCIHGISKIKLVTLAIYKHISNNYVK